MPVGARHLSSGKEVPAALAARMAVDHSNGAGPSGVLTRLLGDDPRGRGMQGIHVRRRDALHHDRLPPHLPDHAAHELGGEPPILELQEATGLVGQNENASWLPAYGIFSTLRPANG